MFQKDSAPQADEKQVSPHKQYLGDGVYADFDGYALVLTTENGYETTNVVVLEPQVYESLLAYVTRLNGGVK